MKLTKSIKTILSTISTVGVLFVAFSFALGGFGDLLNEANAKVPSVENKVQIQSFPATATAVDGATITTSFKYSCGGDALVSFQYGSAENSRETTGRVIEKEKTSSLSETLSGLPAGSYWYKSRIQACGKDVASPLRYFDTKAEDAALVIATAAKASEDTSIAGQTNIVSLPHLSLEITNNKSVIKKNLTNVYTIEILNTSNLASATDTLLSVQLPNQLMLENPSIFSYNPDLREASVFIGELLPTQSKIFLLSTFPVHEILEENNQASVRARVSYANGITTTSASATDSDEIETSRSMLGAFSLGSIDLAAATLWVLGVALLLALMLSARAFRNQSIRISKAKDLLPRPVATQKDSHSTYRHARAERKKKPAKIIYKKMTSPLPYYPAY